MSGEGPAASAHLTESAQLLESARSALAGMPELEHYEHHSPFLFPDWHYGSGEPARLLRQERRKLHYAEGESFVPVLRAGYSFSLDGHPIEHLDGAYAVTAVRHRGMSAPDSEIVYENDFECVPASVPFCMPRPERRSVMVVLTATVVGPGSDDIYTDAMGQIKVQFHWDREGEHDEHSSCWLRTMQSWAGSSWGSQFIPRVGMEVVVTFEGGDPDKPIALGCLNNATHPAAFLLPSDKTRSGFRTRSSPEADGHNELSFEDLAGKEQVFLRAQRDFDEEVLHDHSRSVSSDEKLSVGGNRVDSIGHNLTLRVGEDLEELISGDRRLTVDGSRHIEVRGNQNDIFIGGRDLRVSGFSNTLIGGKETVIVDGPSSLTYGADQTTAVHGSQTVLVGRPEANRAYQLHAEGTISLNSTRGFEIRSDKELTLRCGNSSIRLTSEDVVIDAPTVSLGRTAGRLQLSDSGLKMSSPGVVAQILDELFMLKTDGGASMFFGSEIHLDALKILLNSPTRATDDVPEPPGDRTVIELTDQYGNPLPNQRYIIKLSDGSEISGRLNEHGKDELDLEEAGQVIFPDLTNVQ